MKHKLPEMAAWLLLAGTLHAQSPVDDGNLILWLKADAIVGAADGDEIAAWPGSSTTVASSATTTRGGPTYVADAGGGIPGVRFDASGTLAQGDGMSTTASVGSGDFTIFLLFNSESTSAGGRRTINGSSNWLIGPYNNRPRCYNGSTFIDDTASPGDDMDSTFLVVRFERNSGMDSLFVDGVNRTSGTPSGTNYPGSIGLGTQGQYAESMLGVVAEVLVYDRVLTPQETSDIETYLAARRDPLNGILPAGQPLLSNSGLVSVGATSAEVSTDLSNADGDAINLYYGTTDLGESTNGWDHVRSIPAATAPATLTGDIGGSGHPDLTADTRYFYIFNAINSGSGLGDWSPTGRSFGTILAGLSVSSPSATAVSPNQIDLAWSEGFNSETGFVIEQSGDGTTGWTQVGTAPADATGFSVTGLDSSTRYFFRIAAENESGLSDYSAVVDDTTPFSPTSIGNFTGGDVGEGLDLTGNVVYALNVGVTSPNTYQVQGVDFEQDESVSGVTVVSGNQIDPWSTKPDYGSSTDDDALENIMHSVRDKALNPSPPSFDLAVTSGNDYRIQLLFSENFWTSGRRVIDVLVEGGVIADDVSIYDEGGSSRISPPTGLVITHTYTAADEVLDIDLDVGAGATDANPLIQAIIVTDITALAPGQPVLSGAAVANISAAAADASVDLAQDSGTSTVTLFWDIVDQGTGTWTNSATPQVNQSPGTVNDSLTGLTADTVYFYRFYAENSSDPGLNGWSQPATSFATALTGLSVSSPAANAVSAGRIDLSWVESFNTETGFVIERSTDGTTNWVEVGTAARDATGFSDTGLSQGTKYFYRIAGENGVGLSDYSSVVSATTLNKPFPILVDFNAGASPVATVADFSSAGVTGLLGTEVVDVAGFPSGVVNIGTFTTAEGLSITLSDFIGDAYTATNVGAGNFVPAAGDLLTDYINFNRTFGGQAGPVLVSLGNLGLSASTTYTLYLFGDNTFDVQDGVFTPQDGANVTFASTADGTGIVSYSFTTGAGYVDGIDTIDVRFARQGGTGGEDPAVGNQYGVLGGFAITGSGSSGGSSFADWIADFPGVGALTAFSDDADSDGLENGLENFLGTDPSIANVAGINPGELDTTSFGPDTALLPFTHPRNDDPGPASDVSGSYEWSFDLVDWYADGADVGDYNVSFQLVQVVDGIASVNAYITKDSAAPLPGKLFVRIRATQN